jgi:hypothetical protein
MLVAAAPPPVVQIARRVQSQEQGIVLYRLHRLFDVHAGPMHRHDDLELAVVSRENDAIKVRVLHAFAGGKSLDDAQTRQLQDRYEHPRAEDVFHRPFDPAYVDEYSYQAVDAKTYRFTSVIHDGSHGNGTFWLDDDGNVVKYQYTPNVMPQYASSGTISDERTQVLPGLWQLTSEVWEFRGHYAIFGGGATARITCDSFERYADLTSAEAALDSVTPNT